MTSRERLIAVARGEAVDRRPLICWPIGCSESDATLECGNSAPLSTARPDAPHLATVVNPFGRAAHDEVDLSSLLADSPAAGETKLEELVRVSRQEARKALDAGAAGILYVLHGAHPSHTTPMEYGGHFLERDREILSEFADATFNLVFVIGGEGTYLDFVSDLPAHAFGWDSQATGVTPNEMRQIRQGALATNHHDADIELRFGVLDVTQELEMRIRGAHAV